MLKRLIIEAVVDSLDAALAAEAKLSPVLIARIREVLDRANLADPSEPGLEEVDIPAFLRRGVE